MEDDADVRKLVVWIFSKQVENVSEMAAPNSPMPACLLTRDFPVSIDEVLSMKKMIIPYRWKTFIDTLYDKMFASHEMYLTQIMFACQAEHKSHRNIFESFVSVCAVLKYLSEETLFKTKMDFCDLNPDVFMVFYQNDMKKLFRKRGGFQQLVEYIRGHRYLTWNPNAPHTNQKIAEEINKQENYELKATSDEIAAASFLAKDVLSMTSVGFPRLLSKAELIQNMVAYRRNKITINAEMNKFIGKYLETNSVDNMLPGLLNSNSDTKTKRAAKQKLPVQEYEGLIEAVSNAFQESSGQDKANNRAAKQKDDSKEYENITEAVINILPRSSGQEKANNRAAEKKEDIAEHEKIIEAVIRCNHSKSSGQAEANNPLLKEAYGILEHLKDNIKSFIEVLDQYDEE